QGAAPNSPATNLTIAALAERISIGGWPGHLGLTVAAALQANRDYLSEIARVDVRTIAGPRRDPEKITALLAALARNVATHAAIKTLGIDAGGAGGAVDRDTVHDYLVALDRLM